MTAIEWIQKLLGTSLQPLFLGITNLGSEYAYIVFLSLYYWLVNPRTGRQLGLLIGFSYGFNVLCKALFDYPRPFELNPNIASPEAIATIEHSSFPSGHAQSSATFWVYIALYHQHLWLWISSIIIITLIAISRLYLGVHFPIDVVGGLLIGILFAVIGTRCFFGVRQRFLVMVSVVIVTFLLGLVWTPLARSLGVIAGFYLTKPNVTPPSSWKGRLLFGGIGLLFVMTVYLGSRWLLGNWREQGWVSYWHYCILTFVVTKVWPRLLNNRSQKYDS